MVVLKLSSDIHYSHEGYWMEAILKLEGKRVETEVFFDTFDEAYNFYNHWWSTGETTVEEDAV